MKLKEVGIILLILFVVGGLGFVLLTAPMSKQSGPAPDATVTESSIDNGVEVTLTNLSNADYVRLTVDGTNKTGVLRLEGESVTFDNITEDTTVNAVAVREGDDSEGDVTQLVKEIRVTIEPQASDLTASIATTKNAGELNATVTVEGASSDDRVVGTLYRDIDDDSEQEPIVERDLSGGNGELVFNRAQAGDRLVVVDGSTGDVLADEIIQEDADEASATVQLDNRTGTVNVLDTGGDELRLAWLRDGSVMAERAVSDSGTSYQFQGLENNDVVRVTNTANDEVVVEKQAVLPDATVDAAYSESNDVEVTVTSIANANEVRIEMASTGETRTVTSAGETVSFSEYEDDDTVTVTAVGDDVEIEVDRIAVQK